MLSPPLSMLKRYDSLSTYYLPLFKISLCQGTLQYSVVEDFLLDGKPIDSAFSPTVDNIFHASTHQAFFILLAISIRSSPS